ncbi:50S ribosomal protein L30 [endosymbiont 'TC1' of Trimyema compressum]|nr:50S ribosomal protein L30 [endosymbiont 'TC1' of Trimyema compressum]AMP21399.1 50S ribosomal protein L30 [endosymbiont 'TC1' of Trimyema compressum]
MKEVKVTLVKSIIGRPERQKETVRSLGLGKINSQVIQKLTPDIEGKLNKVSHLVKYEEI